LSILDNRIEMLEKGLADYVRLAINRSKCHWKKKIPPPPTSPSFFLSWKNVAASIRRTKFIHPS